MTVATQAISDSVPTCRCISGCDPKASRLNLRRDVCDHWNGNDVDKSASLSSSHGRLPGPARLTRASMIADGDLSERLLRLRVVVVSGDP